MTIFLTYSEERRTQEIQKTRELLDFIPSFEDIEALKKEHNLNCPARTVSRRIKYPESRPNQKWYVFKSLKRKPYLINVGVYEEFPSIDTALEWSERLLKNY